MRGDSERDQVLYSQEQGARRVSVWSKGEVLWMGTQCGNGKDDVKIRIN
jgi:hypothetical protein